MDLYVRVQIKADDNNHKKCSKNCWSLINEDTCVIYRMFLTMPNDKSELPFRCCQCMEMARGGERTEAFDREMERK